MGRSDSETSFEKPARAGGAPRIKRIICLCNFSPVVRESYRIGAPAGGVYREILDSDSAIYGGSNVGNAGAVMAENSPSHGMPFSLTLRLPPLGVLWLEVPR